MAIKHPKRWVRIEEAGKKVSAIRKKETEEEREAKRERGKSHLQNNIHGDRIAGKRFHYIQRYHIK